MGLVHTEKEDCQACNKDNKDECLYCHGRGYIIIDFYDVDGVMTVETH